ncbi:MAG: hypothetical protein Q7N50_05285, partial [Armatimonadota bacterium]|nr:hypothetical protein [Armatimonadota bacterium]
VGITHTQYRVDSGDWLAVAADDGIFDSGMEQFSLTTQPILPKGEHVIEVKVYDAAGNSATKKATVKM